MNREFHNFFYLLRVCNQKSTCDVRDNNYVTIKPKSRFFSLYRPRPRCADAAKKHGLARKTSETRFRIQNGYPPPAATVASFRVLNPPPEAGTSLRPTDSRLADVARIDFGFVRFSDSSILTEHMHAAAVARERRGDFFCVPEWIIRLWRRVSL